MSLLLRMGQALTASEAEEFMREADLNGDGKLDYDEFARIMSQSISKLHQYLQVDKCLYIQCRLLQYLSITNSATDE